MSKSKPIRCSKCGSFNLTTSDSRPMDTYVRRRRKCLDCDNRVTTYEIEAGMLKQVIAVGATELAKEKTLEHVKQLLDNIEKENENV